MSYAALGAMPTGPWAEIVAKNGFRYQLTDDDVLWSGRMVEGEGLPDAAMVLWSMAQRFAMLRWRSSFARFIRAYSQPINPIWRRTGTKCIAGSPYHGGPRCSSSALDRRDRIASTSWDRLPETARRETLRWARAEMPNPIPRATDFAAAGLVRRKLDRTSRTYDPNIRLVARGLNWFVSKPASRRWDSDDFVTMKLGTRVAGPSLAATAKGAARTAILVGGPVLLVGAAALAFWSYRKAR
jgi:hypothetical protein